MGRPLIHVSDGGDQCNQQGQYAASVRELTQFSSQTRDLADVDSVLVMMCTRLPLSRIRVEDLPHECGVEVSDEPVRFLVAAVSGRSAPLKFVESSFCSGSDFMPNPATIHAEWRWLQAICRAGTLSKSRRVRNRLTSPEQQVQ